MGSTTGYDLSLQPCRKSKQFAPKCKAVLKILGGNWVL